jgi:hypothetical protein
MTTKVKISELVQVTDLKNYYQDQNIDELVISIENDGLKVPITVTPKLEVVDGYRRIQSMEQLGETEIDVRIEDVEPTIYQRLVRNMCRRKTPMDEINDIKTIFKKYPSRQGQRKLEGKYSRYEEISKSLNNRWKDDEVIKKLEYVLNNDFDNNLLGKIIIESNTNVDPCYDFLNKYKPIDEKYKYGYTEKLLKGELTISQTNKCIKDRNELDEKFEPTFCIPDKVNFYLDDSRFIDKLSNYKQKVDTLLSSIPYYQLENYVIGGEQQLGHEETKEEYAMNVVKIIKKQIPLLKKTGNVFINIGETYQDGIALGIPYLIQNYLSRYTTLKYKGTIYWIKKNPKPQNEKVKRDTDSTEHVLWFVLDPEISKYTKLTYLKKDEWRMEISNGAKDVSKDGKRSKKCKTLKKPYKKFLNHLMEQEVENIVKTSVGGNHDIFKISSEGHPCPFNPLLVLNLILMSTEKNDDSLIYDCFAGVAVTGQVSTLLNKRFLGVECNKQYYDIGCEVLLQTNKLYDSESLKVINDFVNQDENENKLRIAA